MTQFVADGCGAGPPFLRVCVGDGEGEGEAGGLDAGAELAASEECTGSGEAALESAETGFDDVSSIEAGTCGMLTAGTAVEGAGAGRGVDVADVIETPDPPELPPSKTIAPTTTTAHPPAATSPNLRRLGLRRRSARRVAEGGADAGAAGGGTARQASPGRGMDTAVGISPAGRRNVGGGSGTGPGEAGPLGVSSAAGGSASGDAGDGAAPVSAVVSAGPRRVGSSGAPVPAGSSSSPNRIRGIRMVERTSCTWPISIPAAPQPGQETAPFRYLRQVLQ
jgi:hypothetical protein